MVEQTREVEILVVDDDPGDVRLILESLKDAKLHNRVRVARDGVECMEIVRRRGVHAQEPAPDLVLLDLNMPRMTGLEVLAEMKSDRHLMTIPVIVLTTSQADSDILDSYQHHANGYVAKPVDLEEFLTAVRRLKDFWISVVTLPPRPVVPR